ncbi:MAG TPA: hypothetical protein VFY29_19880 [Terriglobia bacterium]|nr:hypothetical protein [Terriglobia bacterium]
MDTIAPISVRVFPLEALPAMLESMQDRITGYDYDNFVKRRADGQTLEDAVDAERRLLVRPDASIRCAKGDVIVEAVLPNIGFPNVTVYLGSNQLVISSDPNEYGLQILKMVELPVHVAMDGVDAELRGNRLRVAAVIEPRAQAAAALSRLA